MELYNITQGIDLILTDDIAGLHKLFNINQDTILFESKKEFIEYICGFDISLLFGGKTTVNCIFHNDTHPSASIYNTDGGHFFYTCHSANCNHSDVFDIISLVKIIKGCGTTKALRYIGQYFNCYCQDVYVRKKDCEVINKNIEYIYQLENIAPTANKILGTDKQVLMHLYSNVLKGKYTRMNKKIALSISTRQLIREMGKELKASRSLAVLAYMKLIRKIPAEELPDDKIDKLIELSRHREQAWLRTSIHLEIEELTENKIREIESCALKWKELGYVKSKFTALEICSKEDIYKAVEIYNQL